MLLGITTDNFEPVPPPVLTAVELALVDPHGGIPIKLTGLHIGSPNDVKIGGTSCTGIVSISDTEVHALTPSKAGGASYDVQIITGGGSSTLASAIEYWYPTQVVGLRVYDSELGVTGSPVSAWADQNGGAENLSASGSAKPSIVASRFGDGSRHALVFDGVANQLTLGTPVPFGARSMFAALKHRIKPGNIGQATIVCGPGVAPDNGVHELSIEDSLVPSALRTYDADLAVPFYSVHDPKFISGSPVAIGLTHDGASGDLKFFDNFSQIGPTQTNTYSIGRNAWDRVGNGAGNPFEGELGAVCVSETILGSTDATKLGEWMFGKFLARGVVFTLQNSNTPWCARDGAGLLELNGDLYMLGGWNGSAPPPFFGGTKRTTNEVWKSTDKGVTWTLILAEGLAPWSPRHTAGWVSHSDGYMYIIGSDVFNGPGSTPLAGGGIGTSDVYRSNDGVTWQTMTTTAPWGPRVLHMAASFGGALYVMGGQTNGADWTSAQNDVWKSTDGGVTWTQQPDAPWSKRAQSNSGNGLPTFNQKLWLMGGGTYGGVLFEFTYLNDVWSFDGTTWTEVSASAAWAPRSYNGFVAFDGLLWAINGGIDDGAGSGLNTAEVWTSPDGSTWTERTIIPWRASHADGLCVLSDRIIQGPGNGDVQEPSNPGIGTVWSITRNGFAP